MNDLFKNDRSYQRIANTIARQIAQDVYQAGQALPSERELAKLLNISRASVREAVIALEVSGLLEVKNGSGIYVTPDAKMRLHQATVELKWQPEPELAQFLNIQEELSPFSLLQARLLIEPEIAALAAKNMNQEHLQKIKEAYAMNVLENIQASKKYCIFELQWHVVMTHTNSLFVSYWVTNTDDYFLRYKSITLPKICRCARNLNI